MRFFLRAGAVTTLAAVVLSADVTYQQTTKFKGGALIDMVQKMASMPMMGRMMGGGGMKQSFEDQNYEVYVKGNKLARIGPRISTIYDLDAGTQTMVNHDKQSYTVQTFEEMRERLQQMQERMNKGGADIDFDVKVQKTSQTQQIDGETAKETIILMTAKQANDQGQMVVTVHAWLVPMNALRREAQDFQKRLAEKLTSGMSGFSPMMGAAGAGISAAMREMSRLDEGYPAVTEVAVTGLSSVGGPMGAMSGGGAIDPKTALIDTETSNHQFAKGVADDSKFSVPPGYKEEKGRPRRN
jgi:hypothetical protein